jgi:hypothetical protein
MDNAHNDIPKLDREHAVAATAWFSALMHSARVQDLQYASKALQALEKRGIHVSFDRQSEGVQRGQ